MPRIWLLGRVLLALIGIFALVANPLGSKVRADSSYGHQYAIAYQDSESYTGVKADIEVAAPILRDCVTGGCWSSDTLSSAKVAILNGPAENLKWVEMGWTKHAATACAIRHYWAIQPGTPHFVDWPMPMIGQRYEYRIAQDQAGSLWSVTVYHVDSSGTRISKDWWNYEVNPSFTVGDEIQAFGETFYSWANDMGVSGLLDLHWRDTGSDWHGWHGWEEKERGDTPPYTVIGVPPDDDDNIQVYGNQGNPVPPNAACP